MATQAALIPKFERLLDVHHPERDALAPFFSS
jgi:hypothetical protein